MCSSNYILRRRRLLFIKSQKKKIVQRFWRAIYRQFILVARFPFDVNINKNEKEKQALILSVQLLAEDSNLGS